MMILAFIYLYTSTIAIGYLLATIIGLKKLGEKIGIGWLLSTSMLTYVFFLLYAYADWRYTSHYLTGLLVGTIIILLVAVQFYKKDWLLTLKGEYAALKKQGQTIITEKDTLLLIALICIPLLFGVALNFHWPVIDWDAIALYDYRAKVFALSGGMEDGIIRGYFLHYPLYTSLLHTFSYLYQLQTVRIWYSLLYLSSLLVFYELLRRYVSQKQALVGTFFLAITPPIFQHSQMTYTNLPHAIYLSFGYIYLWEWWRKGNKTDLLVGASLVASSTWVRLTEPLWIPALGLLAIGWWRRKAQWQVTVFSAILIIFMRYPWTQFVADHDKLFINNPLQIGQGLQLPNNPWHYLVRLQEVASFFWISVYPVIKIYTPALFVSGLFVLYKEKWNDVYEYLFYLGLLLFLFAGVFLFSFQFKGWELIPDSAARMAMFLLPITIYLIMKSTLWLTPNSPSQK